MDGNSRWARQRGLPRVSGHQTGVEAMRRTVQFCCRRGIQCLTVFALSTENWQRETEEVEFLLKLIQRVVNQELDELIDAGVQMHFIGDRSRLSPPLIKQLQRYILFYWTALSLRCDNPNHTISNLFTLVLFFTTGLRQRRRTITRSTWR